MPKPNRGKTNTISKLADAMGKGVAFPRGVRFAVS